MDSLICLVWEQCRSNTYYSVPLTQCSPTPFPRQQQHAYRPCLALYEYLLCYIWQDKRWRMSTIPMRYQKARPFPHSQLYFPPALSAPAFLTFQLQDTILWIHIAIQLASFGVIFPTGMVLGVRPLLPPAKFRSLQSDRFSDHTFTVARTSSSLRRPSLNCRLLSRPWPWWSPICA